MCGFHASNATAFSDPCYKLHEVSGCLFCTKFCTKFLIDVRAEGMPLRFDIDTGAMRFLICKLHATKHGQRTSWRCLESPLSCTLGRARNFTSSLLHKFMHDWSQRTSRYPRWRWKELNATCWDVTGTAHWRARDQPGYSASTRHQECF